MNYALDRRTFTKKLAATAGILLGSGANWALPADADAEWAFPLLGDLHFDHLDHHDLAWLQREHPNDVAQVRNYSRVSAEATPKLLAAVRQRMTAARTTVPFILQVG